MNKSCFFYLCEQQFLYLSHRHCLLALFGEVFSVRFWHLGLLVFKLFTWDEVISTDMKVIDWYISHSSGNKYLVVNIGSIQMRSKLNRCKIIFFLRESKVYMKFMYSLYVILKISHENCLDFHEIFRNMYELYMKFLCSFYVISM